MTSWRDGNRPFTLAVLAMGGEGGGVLADWVVAAGEEAGWTAQNTSVAGVAQRTGATVYYVEMLPPPQEGIPAGGRAAPVLSLFPTPGEVDVVIASELMECGRAIQRGFTTPDRTTLITSTNRVYSIDERIHLGDGRVDADELLAAAGRSSRVLVAADFAAVAQSAGSVVSASLFGALAGTGVLPFTREQFEVPIRAFAKAADASLRAFAAGYAVAQEQVAAAAGAQRPARRPGTTGPVALTIGRRPQTAAERKAAEDRRRNAVAATTPEALVGPALRGQARAVRELPAAARSTVLHGLVRTSVYQDVAYAELYLERVRSLAALDPDAAGAAELTTAAARNLALWMCYQDTIQVAAQKTRRSRLQRVREEAKAEEGQLVEVREYLHPRVEEIADTLPTRLGRYLLRSRPLTRVIERVTREGIVLNTTSVLGYTQLAVLARLRPVRPRSLRFAREQEGIEEWLRLARELAMDQPALAREVLDCQQVLKGYGATHAHGSESLALLLDAAGRLAGSADAAPRLARLRTAALADEEGARLRAEVGRLAPSAPASLA
ncbi:indolepyruvate oxidoreductase subunit beta family protein [Geodermatophilus sp. DSM 44513]|uniref:indolepyruvate oxidoreductase subunit beta family protein n=1 Tax=Geodermatophilus sp. DSM 44513 TaxID=1528104 RepID=UPI0012820764|nr:indolepyruvate oxidoreductase subunit beta family protein [Geodermatophilus sp. DSM 44513]WNV77058.1 indolepyruvate oxidoreductase subunit beta family protein [Geodermatophilus sp. DSM 44513]